MSFWNVKNLFQILPFYNAFIEKPEIKKLSNIKLLQKLPFFDELSVVKISNKSLKDITLISNKTVISKAYFNLWGSSRNNVLFSFGF